MKKLLTLFFICGLIFPCLSQQTYRPTSAENIINDLLSKPVKLKVLKGDTFLQKDLSDYLHFTLGEDHPSEQSEESDDHIQVAEVKSYFMRFHPSVSTTRKYFNMAAKEFGVPVSLLMVIGQVENNWSQTGPTIDKGWGMMHLVQNNYANTLGEAAQLLNLPEQELKDNAYHNIRGAAALIANYAGNQKSGFTKLEDWYLALTQYSGLLNKELREMQALTYYEVLKKGVSSSTVWGETIEILPENISLSLLKSGQNIPFTNNKTIPNDPKGKDTLSILTAEYGPALGAFTSCNYTTGRGGYAIDTWVNHWIGTGTYAGAISWFQNCNANASAHFVIRSSDGQITQVVSVANSAWHAGASGYPANNRRSIGVEHEATAANPGLWNSNAMLNASATMSCYFKNIYNFPTTQQVSPGICGHQNMPGTSTSCPGSIPWSNWFSYFNAACNGTPTPSNLSVNTSGYCSNGKSVTFNWTTSATNWNIDVTTNPLWASWDVKFNINGTSTTGPAGFNNNLSFQPGVTYYWRIYNGSTFTYGPSFTVPNCDPLGTVDVMDCVWLAGWAFDPDYSSTSIDVHIYVDGSFATSITANGSRPDVNTVYNITGNHGWSWVVPSIYHDWNTHTVDVYAINSPSGNNPKIGTGIIGPCEFVAPTTLVSVPSGWQINDFTASFTDADAGGSGLQKSFYQVIYIDSSSDWRANANNGFFSDNFDQLAIHPDWNSLAGTWQLNNGVMEQTDENVSNTNIYTKVNQNLSNRYLYHWQGKMTGTGGNRRAGLHIFCDQPTLSERGNSYLIWFRLDDDKIELYKATNNVLSVPVSAPGFNFNNNQWYDFKVTCDRITGQIRVYIDNVKVLEWTDSTPILNGNFVSFRNGNSNYQVNNLKIYRSRYPSVTVSVGADTTKDIRVQNTNPSTPAARVKSIAQDVAGNLSGISFQSVNVDWTPPTPCGAINDGLSTDIDTSFSATQLSANWLSSFDVNSGISDYLYIIGTSPGDSDVVAWTSAGNNLFITHTGLSLTYGNTYYFTIKSLNGAGLYSAKVISDGQYLTFPTGISKLNQQENMLFIYPNPFSGNATLTYTLAESSNVSINITNVLGQETVLFSKQNQSSGKHSITVNTTDLGLSGGVYFITLRTPTSQETIKAVME